MFAKIMQTLGIYAEHPAEPEAPAAAQAANAADPTSTEQEIFVYWDGERERRADPLVLWRKIWNHPECNLQPDYKMAANPTRQDGQPMFPREMVLAAEDRIFALIREVFDVKQFTENSPGLTVTKTEDLLVAFLEYMDELKKKRSPPQTPLPPTDSEFLPPPSGEATSSEAA